MRQFVHRLFFAVVTVPGGKHGGFARDENQRAFAAIEAFLTRLGIQARAPAVSR